MYDFTDTFSKYDKITIEMYEKSEIRESQGKIQPALLKLIFHSDCLRFNFSPFY